ncbi:MAG: Cif family virulence factor [Planctomycetota bacterium]|jgi:ketosteroid isomerase-like protein
MKRIAGAVLAAAAAMAGCGGEQDTAADEKAIREIYAAYRQAVGEGDVEGMKKHLGREKVAELDKAGEMVGMAIEMMQALMPDEVAVTGSDVVGEKASIVVKGTDPDGNTVKGLVNFEREDGAWKIVKESYTVELE